MRVIYWLAIFIVLLIIEIATMGLTTIWFAGGALLAFCAGLVGFGLGVQIAADSDKTDRGEVLQSGEAEDERRESDRTACTGDRRHRYDKGQRAGRDPGPNLVGEDG